MNTPRPILRTVHGLPAIGQSENRILGWQWHYKNPAVVLPSSFARQTGTRMAHIGASRNRPHPPAPVHSPVPFPQFKHLAPSFSRTKIGPMRHLLLEAGPFNQILKEDFRGRGPKPLKVSRTRDLGAKVPHVYAHLFRHRVFVHLYQMPTQLGFSRGDYTARVCAEVLEQVGLLRQETHERAGLTCVIRRKGNL